jgi:hypothetical protein
MSPCECAAAWHVRVCEGVIVVANAVYARANPLRPNISARVLLLLLLSLRMEALIQVTCDVLPGLHVVHASSGQPVYLCRWVVEVWVFVPFLQACFECPLNMTTPKSIHSV